MVLVEQNKLAQKFKTFRRTENTTACRIMNEIYHMTFKMSNVDVNNVVKYVLPACSKPVGETEKKGK